MSRFEKVAKLAFGCLKKKLDYWSYIHVDRTDNYIALFENYKMGDILTEVFYDPQKKEAEIFTFDKAHIEEDYFSELLGKLGIKSAVKFFEYPESDEYTLPLPRSPSGRSKLVDSILHEALGFVDSKD